jgi:ParB family chromosome partitioning protein
VGISDDETVKRLANEVIANGLSVRELEELAKKSKKPTKKAGENKFIAEQYNHLRSKLENKTGFHFNVKGKKNGAGEIVIKFGNEAEFNDIFSYLMK